MDIVEANKREIDDLSLISLNNIHLYRKGSLATWKIGFWELSASFSLLKEKLADNSQKPIFHVARDPFLYKWILLRLIREYERDTTSVLMGHPKADSEIPRQYLHRGK
jgi:hypothetical protein